MSIKRFKTFLTESIKPLAHFEHPEDRMLDSGHDGLAHATTTLLQVHNSLKPGNKLTKIHSLDLKVDGGATVVAGWHPQNGKFFVATKSAFAKNPKLNYTHTDILKNHDHPKAREALQHALDHLPKVIKSGIYQGDFMHSPENRIVDKNAVHFKPNTVKYSIPHDHPESEKIQKSKLGIALHTQMHGDSIESMKAKYVPDFKGVVNHKDVHLLDPKVKLENPVYHDNDQKTVLHHLTQAAQHGKNINHDKFSKADRDTIKQFINHSVRTDTPKSLGHYQRFLRDTNKPQKRIEHAENPAHTDDYHALFTAHDHIEHAKNTLINVIHSNYNKYKFSIDNKPSKPEGFVAINRKGEPTKLVDRKEFSKANFNKSK